MRFLITLCGGRRRGPGMVLLLALLLPHALRAQNEIANWYFGVNAGVTFRSGTPTALGGSAMFAYEACVSPSDAAGNLQFYCNSEKVWNRNHQVMPNGANLGGNTSAVQMGYAPRPGAPGQYYLFTLDAAENQLQNGLRYSLVDMALEGGLGDVVAGVKGLRLPTPTLTARVGEHVAVVPHANRTDYWVVVHGWDNAEFYSFLVTAAGVAATPVTSTVGPPLSPTPAPSPYDNAHGGLRASPNGRHLAMSSGYRPNFDLYDFDAATGRVSNYLLLTNGTGSFRYGLEFSSDNSRLYVTTSDGSQARLWQYDLQAGSPAAVGVSGQLIGTTTSSAAGLLGGPDGKIYMVGGRYLHVVDQPNALGASCGFRANAVSLGGATTIYTLPNMQFATWPTVAASMTVGAACEGAATAFAAAATPAGPGYQYQWEFGDPASGAANAATGPTATHTFSAAGTYRVELQVTVPNVRAPYQLTQQVTVAPPPQVLLGAAVQELCAGQTLVLNATQALPSTYRWQDGSTGATLRVQAPGLYWVEASRNGCTARGEVTVRGVPTNIPNIITPNADGRNDAFVLEGYCPGTWNLTVYNRWGRLVHQQARYDNTWTAGQQPDGMYYYHLKSTATGETLRGYVQVQR